MPTRKKHQRLPNGYGSIRYLGKGRRNAYAVHPPADIDGNRPPAICYVDDWMKGFIVLTAYKAGTYVPGMETSLGEISPSNGSVDAVVKRLLSDYNQIRGVPAPEPGKTFSQLYEEFYTWKFERDKSRSYSKSTVQMVRSGFKHCAALHDKEIRQISYQELQALLDNDLQRHAGKEHLQAFLKQIFKYAVTVGDLDRSPAAALQINILNDDEHGVPFSDEELTILWANKEDPAIELLLILCYSGWRISELLTLKIDLVNHSMTGGIKTAAGKNRVVPIHHAILPLIQRRLSTYGTLVASIQVYRKEMASALAPLGLSGNPKHTPHDCRHTFSRLCEKYGVRENDRKRMMGHSFGSDITNGIYGHRELEDLRAEIEKLKVDL